MADINICWHGTDEATAQTILRDGFKPYTHFAAHLEDALAFGGPFVFDVIFDQPAPHWQFRPEQAIPADRIRTLTRFQTRTLHGEPSFRRSEGAATEGDDDGTDPTTTELLKPRGNGGVVSVNICFNALLLIGDVDMQAISPDSWTQAELDRAYDWAMRVHLKASDNDDVVVPPRPHYVPKKAPNA